MMIYFLLYDSRSGSTLLSKLLEEYEDIFVTNESSWISRYLTMQKSEKQKMIDLIQKEKQFDDWGIEIELFEKISNTSISFSDLLESMLNLHFANRYNKNDEIIIPQNIIIKHPPTNHLSEIIKLLPNVAFITLVRDGRDIHVSKSNSKNIDSKNFSNSVLSSALNWKYKTKLFAKVTPNYIIKYEDLIVNPTKIIEEFLDENKISKNKCIKKRYPIPTSQKSFHNNVNMEIINNNTNKYECNGYTNFVYSAICGSTIVELGYNNLYKINTNTLFHLCYFLKEILALSFLSAFNIIKYLFTDAYRLKMRIHKLIPSK